MLKKKYYWKSIKHTLLNIFILLIYIVLVNIYIQYPESSVAGDFFINININLILELLIVTFLLLLFSIIPRKLKPLKILLILLTLTLYFVVFTAQELSLQATANTLRLVALNNFSQFLLLLNFSMAFKIIIAMLLYFALLKIIFSIKIDTILTAIFGIIAVAILYFITLQYKHSNTFKQSTKDQHILSPAKDLYALIKLNEKLKNKKMVTSLSSKELEIAKKFNLHIDQNKLYPFEKTMLYTQDLPFKSIKDIKPNVIIFYIESLSARLLSPYNKDMSKVTPNIALFAKESMVVKGYYNHATPTAPGLYGQNCSLYPLLTYEQLNNQLNNPLLNLDLKCMPHFFKKNNYATYYMTHTKGTYTNMRKNLTLFGYEKSYLANDILKHYLPKEEIFLGERGLSDHQMMKAIIHFLDKQPKQPFLLGISTIETHTMTSLNNTDGIRYEAGDNNTLNMMYNLDNAFGKFWHSFKNSKYYQNTIVILTGDHALYPTKDYQKVAGYIDNSKWISSVYDHLGLIIYDPTHQLPTEYRTTATSIDFAPSVLHLAGIEPKINNSFLGTSLFEKKDYNNSFGISAYPDFNYYLNIQGQKLNKAIHKTKDLKSREYYHALRHVLEYTRYLQENHRL